MSSVSLIQRSIQYLYETVHRLYIFHTDPLDLLVTDKEKATSSVFAILAHALSRAVVLLSCIEDTLRQVREVISEAKKVILTTRILKVEESPEIRGSILWSRVLTSLATSGLVPQIVLERSLASPENVLLRWLVEKSLTIVNVVRDIVDKEYEKLRSSLGNIPLVELIGYRLLKEKLRNAELLLRNLRKDPLIKSVPGISVSKGETIRKIVELVRKSSWKPRWVSALLTIVDRLIRIEHDIEKLQDILAMLRVEQLVSRRAIAVAMRFLVWRLYELYVLYVMIRSLKSLFGGRVVIRASDREFLFEIRNNEKLRVLLLYNVKPIEKSVKSILALGQVSTISGKSLSDRSILVNACGIPDIVLKINDSVIVCEVKFSRNVSYLTQARFKVLAYMREYNAKIGILVFPGLGIRQMSADDEDIETARLVEYASREQGLKLKLADSSCMYIVPIVPLPEKEFENIDTFRKVFNEIFEYVAKRIVSEYVS